MHIYNKFILKSSTVHIHMKNTLQQLWGGGRTAPRLGLKSIPVPTPDGCVNGGCEKGRTWINDVRR